jgi:hypothetical protein
MQARQASEDLSQRASSTDEFGRINPYQLALVRHAEQESAVFGLSLPATEEVYHRRTVAALIDEMSATKTPASTGLLKKA